MILPHNVQIMPESKHLTDWTIISLRPQKEHAAVRLAAKRWQAKTVALSAFKLSSTADSASLREALRCSIRIASSPAAVRFAREFGPLSGDWLAIGSATAQELFRAGARSVQSPEPQNADGLLTMEKLAHIKNTGIGLLTAPDGRGELERVLAERGALLHIAYVYRREPIRLSARQLARIDAFTEKTAFLVSSQKAFGYVWAQLNARRQKKIKTLICVTSSARLVEYLNGLGITRVICSQSTLPYTQISTLAAAIAQ